MASLNPPCLMVKIFVISFSIAIFALTIVVCEAKHLKTLPQTSLNPKSYHDYSLDYTPILDSNNLFIPRYSLMIQGIISSISKSFEDFDENGPLSRVISTRDKNLQSATASCRELLSLASYNLNISSPTRDSVLTHKTLIDFKTYLCGTMAYIDICLDAFEYAPEKARNIVVASLESSRKNVRDTLSILSTIDDHDHNLDSLMDGGSGPKKPRNAWAWPPSGMPSEEKKLLLDSSKATAVDVVVAKDGSGRFKTISEAINFAPQNSQKRFVIYVKQGKYYENVKVDANKWNIMIFGDGMDKTIVSGMLSNNSGISTIGTATFGNLILTSYLFILK